MNFVASLAPCLRKQSNTIGYRDMLNFLEVYLCCTGFDACSLQSISNVSVEYAGPLVIRKYQESIGQDLGTKSAHGMKPDSAVMPHIRMRIKWTNDSQGLQELRRTRQETEDVEENKTKGLIIIDMELVAAKHQRAWVDKVDENSQRLETYDVMRKTTESEREVKDQITEQANKYACNGGRRYREPSKTFSKIESVESMAENEMLSVKVHPAKTICWNQVNCGADAEKHVSDDAKKTLAESTQLLAKVLEQLRKSGMTGLIYETLKTKHQMQRKVPQVKEGREVLEKLQELNKENGKDDTKLRNFAARFNRLDGAVQLQQGAGYLDTAQFGAIQRRAAVDAKDEETVKSGLTKLSSNCAEVPKSKVGKPDVWNPEGVGSQMAE